MASMNGYNCPGGRGDILECSIRLRICLQGLSKILKQLRSCHSDIVRLNTENREPLISPPVVRDILWVKLYLSLTDPF